jgi:hypothetical protein
MKYLINQQIKRFIVIALMIAYTYLQLYHIIPFNWLLLLIVYVVGLVAIVVITAKIRIVSAHIEHCKKEGDNYHV